MIDKNIFEMNTEGITTSMGNIKNEFVNRVQKRINETIKDKKCTKSSVIEKIGVSKSGYYSHIKRGQLPSLETLLKISALLGCDCGYLLCESDKPVKDASDIMQITNLSYESIEYLITHKNDEIFTAITSAIILEMNDIVELIQLFYHYHEKQYEFDNHPKREFIKKIYRKYPNLYDYTGISSQINKDENILKEKLPKGYSHGELLRDLKYYNDILSHKQDALLISLYRAFSKISERLGEIIPYRANNIIKATGADPGVYPTTIGGKKNVSK